MKSRICINALALRTGGGLSYVAELVPHLQRLHGAQATRVLITRSQFRTLGWSHTVDVVVLPDLLARPVLRLLFEAFLLPVALIFWRCDSVLMCGNVGLLVCPGRQVVVQHASFQAAAASRAVFQRLKWQLKRMLSLWTSRSADAVVYVSGALQDELVALGFPAGRIIHHGASPIFRPLAPVASRRAVEHRHGLADPYILCVSDIYPHKNLELAVRVLHALRESTHPAMTLVVAGAPEDQVEATSLRQLAKDNGLTAHVKLIGRVERKDLCDLYNAAGVVLAPSTAESFGMQLLEALRCGVPVVCSRIPAFREVAGDAGLGFDPHDVGEATRLIRQALQLERPYQRGVEHASGFSWEATAALTMEALVPASRPAGSARLHPYLPAARTQHQP